MHPTVIVAEPCPLTHLRLFKCRMRSRGRFHHHSWSSGCCCSRPSVRCVQNLPNRNPFDSVVNFSEWLSLGFKALSIQVLIATKKELSHFSRKMLPSHRPSLEFQLGWDKQRAKRHLCKKLWALEQNHFVTVSPDHCTLVTKITVIQPSQLWQHTGG